MKSRTIVFLLSILLVVSIIPQMSFAWGNWGHEHITATAIKDLPMSMLTVFQHSSTYLQNNAIDSAVRSGWDPNESYFHFIDLGGTNTGSCQWPFWSCMPQSLPAYFSQFGGPTSVISFNAYIVDSISRLCLVPALQAWKSNPSASNYTTVMTWMCREAHYMEDLSQPLHVTWNYNANGVHARYESDMLNTFTPTISVITNAYSYQTNILQYAFSMISTSYPYGAVIDSADTAAENAAGSTSNGTYYTLLWATTQSFTTTLLNASAVTVATVWYTAWVNAGLAVPINDWKLYATEENRWEYLKH